MKSMKKEKGGGTSQQKGGSSRKSTGDSARQTGESEVQTSSDNSELMDFFVDELKDIYWAEKHLVKALPKMVKASTSEELRNAFQEHLDITEEHVSRLEEVFSLLDEKAVAKKCDAMAGLVEEAGSIITDTDSGTMTRDVGLILAAQKVEHYEIATYGGLRTLARVLGNEEVATILQTTLDEEEEADKSLSGIAESYVNEQASKE
jgi:ferritin-like metal-binding protein YciE